MIPSARPGGQPLRSDFSAPGVAVRQAAFDVLSALREGEPWDLALDRAITPLAEADRHLAHEIAAGVCRHRIGLDIALQPLLHHPLSRLDPGLRDILHLGAYQFVYLDRIPVHAAVDTAVTLARQGGHSRAAGLVNAVLRRLVTTPEHREAIRQAPTHPPWLLSRWTRHFGAEPTARLAAWNDSPSPLVVQPARWTDERIATAWTGAGIPWKEAPFGAGLQPGTRDPRSLPGFAEGGFIVQDSAQALVVRSFGIPPGAVVLDACAAPGGKTISMGRIAGLVIAGERSPGRLTRLRASVRRAGSGRELILRADAAAPAIRPVEVVVLDVPCLGTGTLARHPDARWRVTREALRTLVAQGAALLESTARVVRPGGWLCFSTCSLEPEENEEQVETFLARHPHFVRDPAPGTVPDVLRTPGGDLSLRPHDHATDGAFASRLRRVS